MLDQGRDQAAGLRRLREAPGLSLLAFPLREGTGEAWIAQLARGLRGVGARPVVVDASRGRVLNAFGLRARHELLDLLHGTRDFDGVAEATREGIYVMRADRGLDAFVATGAPSRELFAGFARLSHRFDSLLLAMPAHELASLVSPAQAVPVVAVHASDEGLTRAYAAIKQLASGYGYQRFAAVLREGPASADAIATHARLADVARRFLGADVQLAGSLPERGTDAVAPLAELAQNLLHMAATPLSLH
jgi:MinD-like ATPase involved in chromosome partitioning or flagellar assembly